MRWQKGRRSSNVQDRRGQRSGGGGRRIPRGGKVGGGTLLLVVIAVLFFGQDATQLIDVLGGAGQPLPQQQAAPPAATPGATDEAADFVSVMLASTEDVWQRIFADAGARYPEPELVLYTDMTPTACGMGQAATGPFYCPADQDVYLDLGFFRELQRMGASGDFAVAYVIAHEVGHHIQTVTGTEGEVRRLQQRASRVQANQLSVLMELQADCYAGVWAHHSNRQNNWLDAGDVEEGLQAAAAVGDDRLQRMAGQRVQPEAFTHGTSAQRMQWFRTGLETGNVDACDTFGQAGL